MIRHLTTAKTYRPYDGKTGTYASVVPDDRSVIKISEWVRRLGYGFDESEIDELHCTVVYSKKVLGPVTYEAGRSYSARLERFEYLPGHDNAGYVVAILYSPELEELHKQWLARGAVHSFPDYTPHITLVKDLSRTDQLYARMVRLSQTEQGTILTLFNHQVESLKSKA